MTELMDEVDTAVSAGSDVKFSAYAYKDRRGCLVMREGHAADMSSAVALFERIDPAVECVHTFSGNLPTAIYVRRKNGAWTARQPKGAKQ
jgi:hypothetical protein